MKVGLKIYLNTLFISLLLLTTANSAQTYEISLQQMCVNSGDIIIATPIEKKSYKNPGSNHIFTDVILKIKSTIKGNKQPNELMTMTYYGGTIDDKTTYVIGDPQFRLDEESILFLYKRNDHYRVYGLAKGKFNIVSDDKSNKKIKPDFMTKELLLETNGAYLSFEEASSTVNLVDFINIIQSYL